MWKPTKKQTKPTPKPKAKPAPIKATVVVAKARKVMTDTEEKDVPAQQAAPKSYGGYYGSGQVATADYSGPVGGKSVLADLTDEEKTLRNAIIEASCSGYDPNLKTGPVHEGVATGNASVSDDEDDE